MTYVIAVSKVVKESVKHDRVTVIYNGIKVEPTSPYRETNRSFTIRTVGRLDKIKGYDLLIHSCAKLPFDYSLELVGDGEERESLETLSKTLGIEERVAFLGFRTDIPDVMARADLIVMSSHSEGCSIAALEALFYSKVFISTPVGNATEVLPELFITDHNHLTEKISSIAKNHDYYIKEFNDLRETLKSKFVLDNIVTEYIDYYDTVLACSKQNFGNRQMI